MSTTTADDVTPGDICQGISQVNGFLLTDRFIFILFTILRCTRIQCTHLYSEIAFRQVIFGITLFEHSELELFRGCKPADEIVLAPVTSSRKILFHMN